MSGGWGMDKESYERVTEVLSPFTGIEFVPKELLAPACERGTQVHQFIEGVLEDSPFSICSEVVRPYVESFSTFWDKSKHAYKDGNMTLEKRLFCDDKKIKGKPDLIVETFGKTYVLDWKTSASPHKSWALQGAAYRYLLEVNGYQDVDSVLFIKLSKEGKGPTLYKHDNHEENLEVFFKCLELYRWFSMKTTRNK